MPKCGSQIVLCDIPVRFDTYKGCGHGCSYCFVSRKTDIRKIELGESITSLKSWIKGKRTPETNWCDWNIPLHWGGVSDPFQPVEKVERKSLEALEVFADSGYPFVVSTKNAMIADEPYFSLIKKCNCVVQFSACSPHYDKIERGASPFSKRIEAAYKIAKFKRVNIRVQPYIPSMFQEVIKRIPEFANNGIYGIIVEGMKYTKPVIDGLCKVGGDYCYPVNELLPQFQAIKATCHKYGIRFYSGENRLRSLSDDLCCCGIDGMGWRVNTANLNHYFFDKEGVKYTDKMKEKGTAMVWGAIEQTTLSRYEHMVQSYEQKMGEAIDNPSQFRIGGSIFTKKQEERLRLYLVACLKDSGRKRSDIDKLLGTNGMAGHYFGASQWAMPTREAYEKMRTIMPKLGNYDRVLSEIAGVGNGKVVANGSTIIGRIR